MIPADSLATDPGSNLTLITALVSAVGVSIVTPIVGLLANRRHGKKKDEERQTAEEGRQARLEKLITANHQETSQRFATVELELRDLRGFITGPDGENGLRGDMREMKEEVKGIVQRERERLEHMALHGGLDRRSLG